MKVLIFLGLLLFAFAEKDEKRLHEESIHLDCINKGPNYWCQSDVTATKCHAEKYCKMYVWPKETAESSNMDTCCYCQNFVDTLHTMIESKTTQTEIVAALKMFCGLLPDSTKSICATLIDQYGQTIVDDLVKYTEDGKAFCTMIDLCSADAKRVPVDNRLVMMKKVITDKVFGDYCLPCKEYITDLHSIVSSKKTKSDLVGAMKKMCQFLPGAISTWCPRMVDAYGDQIVDSLFKYTLDPSRPCADFGVCRRRDVRPLLVQIPEEFDTSPVNDKEYIKFTPEATQSVSLDVCTTCQQVIGTLHMLLENPETQAQVLAALTTICIELPFGGKTICEEIIDDYGKTIIKELLDYIQDPRKLCTAVLLCSANSERVLPNNFLILTQLQEKVNGDYCLSCKQHIRHVYTMTSSMEMKSDLIRGMKGVCQFLPKAIQSWCVGMVDAKGEQLINSFIEYTSDPSHFCASMLLCKNRDVLPVTPAKTKAIALKGSKTCTYCEQVFGTIHLVLEQYTNEIIAGLDSACNSIPGFGKIVCDEIVQVYGKTIIKQLVDYLQNPGDICKLIHLCPANIKSQNLPSKNQMIWKHAVQEPKNKPSCEICVFGMGYLHKALESHKTEEEIKKKLDHLCQDLPASLSSECTMLVDQYEEQIIKLLVAGTEPETICKELGLCSSSKKDALAPKFGIPCSLCEYGVQLAELSLADEPTQQRMKFALMLLCSKLPSKQAQTECTSAITNYFDEIINVLVTEMKNPKLLCQAVQCTSGKVFHLPKGIICDTCVKGITEADKILECNKTKEVFIGVLNHVCAMTPIADMCKQFATKYASAVFHFLHEQMKEPKETCTKLHLCGSTKERSINSPAIKDGPFCQVCEVGAQYVATYLNNNETKNAVLGILLQVCHMIPIPAVVGECDTLVKEEFNTIYAYLIAQFQNPEALCTELGLCSGGKKRITKIPTISVKDSPVCTVCEIAVEYIDTYLREAQTEAEVKANLLMACSSLPIQSLASKCQSLVEQNFEMMYSLVVKMGENPEAVCKELQLCTSSAKSVSSSEPGPICTTCEIGAQFLLEYMNKSDTKATIKQALNLVCSELPAQFATECQSYVNLYFPIAYSLLLQELANPQSFCQLIKLCPGSVKKVISNGIMCQECKFAINAVDTFLLKNSTKAIVLAGIKTLCAHVPLQFFATECVAVFTEYGDDIIALFVEKILTPDGICELVKLCPESVKTAVMKPKKSNNIVSCELCQLMMTKLAGMLNGSRIEAEVKGALDKLCSDLPYKQECTTLVNTYAVKIIHLLVEEVMQPEHICSEMRLCGSFLKAKNSFTCDICDATLQEVDKMLQQRHNRDLVVKALHHVCARLPNHLNTECNNLMTFYAPQILKYIADELKQPKNFCKDLKLCKVKAVSKRLRKLSPNGLVKCEICEYLIRQLVTQLKGKKTKEEIEKEIEVLCDKLPSSYTKQCKHLIEKYGGNIIDMIVSEVGDEHLICQKLHYCGTKLKAIGHMKRKAEMILGGNDNPASCRLCMFMSGKLDVYLKKNYNKKVMKKILKTICKRTQLNDEMLGSCMRMMAEYEDTIIKLVKEGNIPAFCKKTGQCMSANALTSAKVMNSKKTCLVCEYSVGVLDTYLSTNSTKEKIIAEIKDLCWRVPFKFFQVECKAIFTEYGSEMIELFAEKILAPVTICESVNLC